MKRFAERQKTRPRADGGENVLSLGEIFNVAITHQSGVCPELIRTRVLHYAAAAPGLGLASATVERPC
jgi:hypothetical protein